MNKSKILMIKTKDNRIMDLAGFALFSAEEWRLHLEMIKIFFKVNTDEHIYLGIGGDKELYFKNVKEYTKQIKVTEITRAEANKLMKQFKIKLNDGTDKKTYGFSDFGTLTLFNKIHLEDAIRFFGSTAEEKWLEKKGMPSRTW